MTQRQAVKKRHEEEAKAGMSSARAACNSAANERHVRHDFHEFPSTGITCRSQALWWLSLEGLHLFICLDFYAVPSPLKSLRLEAEISRGKPPFVSMWLEISGCIYGDLDDKK